MEFPIHFLTATIGGTCLYILLTIATGLAVHPLGIRLPDYTPIFDPFVWLAGLLLGAYMNLYPAGIGLHVSSESWALSCWAF